MSNSEFLIISFYFKFTIYLFNSFFFIVLSSPHPYYDFYFHLFVNCKLSLALVLT